MLAESLISIASAAAAQRFMEATMNGYGDRDYTQIGRYLIGGGNFRLPAGGALGIEIKELDYGKGLLKFLVTPDVARKCQR